jgi:hypothetical protein
MAVCS